jgi:hypothetical protein
MSGNNPVTFKAAPAPKHKTLRIQRGHIVKQGGFAGGVDPNLEEVIAELKKRGVKMLGYTVNEEADEYLIRVMVPKQDGDGDAEGDKPRIYVP